MIPAAPYLGPSLGWPGGGGGVAGVAGAGRAADGATGMLTGLSATGRDKVAVVAPSPGV
jgi:hypothetical protein